MATTLPSPTQLKIRRAKAQDAPAFFEHFVRHFDESGNDDIIFQPTNDHKNWVKADYVKQLKKRWAIPLTELGGEAMWILHAKGVIQGHASLRSGRTRTSLHRCSLGIGLEKPARGHGFGRKLMEQAIAWARKQPSLDVIDLYVFSHNIKARRLYKSLGFTEVSEVKDSFRVEDQSIDDVHMILDIKSEKRSRK